MVAVSIVAGPRRDQRARHGRDLACPECIIPVLLQALRLVLIPLPIGLFCIVAYNISRADPTLLKALLSYGAFYWVAGPAVLVTHILILSIATRTPPWRPLVALNTPLILAFATDNPFVALYSAIESLQKEYGVPRAVADTVVPFGVLANQHGQVTLFAYTAVFLTQVYGIELGPVGLATIALGVILAGAPLAPIRCCSESGFPRRWRK
jgi:Na+/H+-dicarboxylate symporter